MVNGVFSPFPSYGGYFVPLILHYHVVNLVRTVCYYVVCYFLYNLDYCLGSLKCYMPCFLSFFLSFFSLLLDQIFSCVLPCNESKTSKNDDGQSRFILRQISNIWRQHWTYSSLNQNKIVFNFQG